MKNFIISLLLVLLSSIGFSQNIVMTQNNGATVNVAEGQTFSLGAYAPNTLYTMTLCSSDPLRTHVGFVLNSYAFKTTGTDTQPGISATLKVYEGTDATGTPSAVFDNFSSGTVGMPPNPSNPSGCLTLVFQSPVAGCSFNAGIHLKLICKARTVEILSTNPPFSIEDGVRYINLCWDYENKCTTPPVEFVAKGTYPANAGYEMSDETSIFTWDAIGPELDIVEGDGLSTITKTFTQQRGYAMAVSTKDLEGCVSGNDASVRIRVARSPSWSATGSFVSPPAICPGEEATAICAYQSKEWKSSFVPAIAEVVDLPDGQGVCYESPIRQNQFEPGVLVESGSDVVAVCTKIRHTFVGDLRIFIMCSGAMDMPVGTQIALHLQGGGTTNLGIPEQNISYEYCWTNTATITMAQAATPLGDVSLPPGSFKPVQSFDGLIGCPLNGIWTLKICDFWAADAGVNTGWTMHFKEEKYPEPWTYTPEYTPVEWTGSFGSVLNPPLNKNEVTGTYIETATPDQTSNEQFFFKVKDDFGCFHDTALDITVYDALNPNCCTTPTPDAGGNKDICGVLKANLTTTPPVGNTGLWELVSGPGTAGIESTTSPSTTVTVSVYGEYVFKWTEHYKNNAKCTGSVEVKYTFKEELDPQIQQIPSLCVGQPPIQIQAVNYGVMSCSPNPELLDPETYVFTPNLPGTFTISNKVLNPCTNLPITSSQTVTVNDKLMITNHSETCIPDGEKYNIEIKWEVKGSQGDPITNYSVDGVPQTSPNYSVTIPSPGNYQYTVTDVNGCSSEFVQGYRDCGCPLFAGTMHSLELVLLCETECSNNTKVKHNGNAQTGSSDSGNSAGVLKFMIHKGNNIPIKFNDTPEFCKEDLEFNTTYYISAICGYPDGNGNPKLEGCYSISPGTRVRWMKNTSANAGEDQNICGLQATLNATAPEVGYGYWTSPNAFVPINGTSNLSPNMQILATEYGTYNFTWHVENGDCSATDDVKITFNKNPQPFAGVNQIVCGNTMKLNGTSNTQNPGASFSWSEPTGKVTFAPNDQLTTVATANQYDGVEIFLTESFMGCIGTSSVVARFIEVPAPKISPIVPSETCGNRDTLLVITGENPIGNWVAWNVDEDDNPTTIMTPAPLFQPASTNPKAIVTLGNYVGDAKKVRFVWTEKNTYANHTCQDSVVHLITFAKPPVAAVNKSEDEKCGSCIDLVANVGSQSIETGTWLAKMNGQFTNEGGPTNPKATFCIDPTSFGNQSRTDTDFYWTVSNPVVSSCRSSATVTVAFYKEPTVSIGADDAVCGKEYKLEVQYSPANSNGMWSVVSKPEIPNIDPSATFGEDNMVQVTNVGFWEFMATAINPQMQTCRASKNVKIQFVEKPIINAGEDFNVCGNETELNAVGGGATGSWLQNSAVTFSDINSPTTQVSVISYGEIDFIWQETVMAMPPSTLSCGGNDTVKVTFYPKPEPKLLSPEEDKVCGLEYTDLRAAQPNSNLEGFWNPINCSGCLFQDVTSNSTSVKVPNYGTYQFEWVLQPKGLSDSECRVAAGPITINFLEQPVANAGKDTTICGLKGNLGAIPSVGKGIWTAPSELNITFTDPTSPTSEVVSQVYSTSSNQVFKLSWTENNEGCTHTDKIDVRFAEVPSSEIVVIPPKCFGEPAIIKATDETLATYDWEFYGGIVDSVHSNNNLPTGAYRCFVHWTDKKPEHEISLQAKNAWCLSVIKKDVVTEPELPEFTAKIIKDTCNLSRGGILFENEDFSYFWTDSIVGPTVGSSIPKGVSNIPAGVYNIKTTYQSFNSSIPNYLSEYIKFFKTDLCTNMVEYTVPAMGDIKVKFEVSPDVVLEKLTAPEAKVIFVNNTDYDGIKKRCIWNFGDGEVQKKCDELIEHTYTKAGCFYPELIIINKELPECSDTLKLSFCISVKDQSILEVPNIFSPNGDGINDYFQVKATSLSSFVGVIVNRWGKTVYTWSDWKNQESGWDGKINGGSDASPGVYYYIIKAQGLDEKPYEFKGALHLMRE